MPNRFWIGGTGTWDGTTTTHWSPTSGGAGGAPVPTSADDVFFDANSGTGTITTASGSICRNLDCTGYTGTLTGGVATVAGSITLASGMTVGVGSIAWSLQAAAPSTIKCNGKTFGNTLTIASGTYTLLDALSCNALGLTSGTFDTGSFAVTCSSFTSSNSNTRTLTLGSSAITVTGASGWSASTATNLTITANTATVTLSGAAAIFSGGSINWNGLSLVFTGSGVPQIQNANTFANVTRTGTAVKTDGLSFQSGPTTITGTFTVNGNSTTNRVLIQSSAVGTARSVVCNGTVSASNVDFMDIAASGTASWDLHAITGLSGDCGGNSGITFTTPATQTHTASAGGNWSDATKWTSRVPLPQDNVVVDVNTTGTLTFDMPRLGADISFTGFTAATASGGIVITSFGSFTLASGMTWSAPSMIFAGRGTHTFTSSGKTFVNGVTFQGPNGSYTLQDALSSTGTVVVNNGSFIANNFNVTCTALSSSNTAVRSINCGTGTWTFTSTSGNVWNTNTGTNLTLSAASASFVISTASTSSRAIALGNSQAFGAVTYTVANSPGTLSLVTVAGGSYVSLNIGPGRGLALPASTTTSFAAWNVNGAPNGYSRLPGVSGNYASVPDSTALSITGDLDIRCAVALDSWASATQQSLLSKFGATGHRSYRLLIENSTGLIQLFCSSDGTANTVVADSTVAPTVSAGGLLAVRATISVNNGAGGRDIKFYTKSTTAAAAHADTLSDTGWTQLGSTVTQAGTTSIFDSDAVVEIGSDTTGTTRLATGNFYAAVVKNGIAGTTALDIDLTRNVGSSGWLDAARTQFAESSSNAATVTINGTLAQAGDGRIALTSSTGGTQATVNYTGTGIVNSDYLTIQDSNATPANKWFAGHNSVLVSNTTGWTLGTGFLGDTTMTVDTSMSAAGLLVAQAAAAMTVNTSMSASALLDAFSAAIMTVTTSMVAQGQLDEFAAASMVVNTMMTVSAVLDEFATATMSVTTLMTALGVIYRGILVRAAGAWVSKPLEHRESGAWVERHKTFARQGGVWTY